jgi:primosomal protein N''
MFPKDWIKHRRNKSIAACQDQVQTELWRETSQSLAVTIQDLCQLLDSLVEVVEGTSVSQENRVAINALPAQIQAVRSYAACIADDKWEPMATPSLADDPYSLTELRRLVDHTH